MKRITELPDWVLLTLMENGKKNGARPFLRHVKVMIEVREELMRRNLMPLCAYSRDMTNLVLPKRKVPWNKK